MDEEIDGINVVPLVDVMLVLLTIVLTTATFISAGRIPIDLARAPHAAPARPAPTVLTLTLDGGIFLNDRAVPDLAAALAALSHETPIIVRADGGLPLRTFIATVDRVKALGFAQVSLEVRRT
ncbi:MAG TPA: biopolymer transporter ExbD [Thiobacillaceae bacterium]|nr:biopolymer transporter ExbD [Thiobacillaceae bacterium]